MASVLLAGPATAAVRYAKPAASGAGTCLSWTNACTLQTALTGAVSGDEIWVLAGAHTPTATTTDRVATFLLRNGVGVYGGFAGFETLRTQRNWLANVTVLSGDIDNNDSQTPVITDFLTATGNATNSYHVVTGATGATLDGVTITAGYADGAGAGQSSGGGMYSSGASPTLVNLVAQGNYASLNGGGIAYSGGQANLTDFTVAGNFAGVSYAGYPAGGGVYCNGATVVLTRGTFTGNRGYDFGGALFIGSGVATLTDVHFVANTSMSYGGGLDLENSVGSTFTNVTFVGNHAVIHAGGARFSQSRVTFTNGLFRGNKADFEAGGLLFEYDSGSVLTNVTFHGNSTGSGSGGAIKNNLGVAGTPSTPTLRNSILWGNTPNSILDVNAYTVTTVRYSTVEGGCSGPTVCTNVTTSNPAFWTPVNPATAPTTAGDAHLRPSSPAIDSGDNNVTTPSLPATDLEGNTRRINTPTTPDTGNGSAPIVDKGAYEFPGPAPELTATKTHTPAGSVGMGTTFDWILTVRNAGTQGAAFPSGQVILRDDLPTAGATYGVPTVASTNVTGTVACAVDGGFTLTCTASGAVSLAATNGQVVVTVPVTATTVGTLQNPRAAGVCLADPADVVYEANESNNGCSETVHVGTSTATVASVIHDASHNLIATAPVGSSIHGQATVTGTGPTPTGSITLGLYGDATCSGPPVTTETVPLVGGVAESSSISAVSFYYRVTYSGDAIYTGVTGACTLFTAYQPGPTFTVNTLADDVGDGLCSDVHCTLREAVTAANADPANNTVTFSVTGTISLGSTLPTLAGSGSLSIDGVGQSVVVSGSSAYRVFTVDALANVSIRRLTIADGSMPGPSGTGAGIFTGGTLSLSDSTLTGNSAEHAGALHVAGGNTSLVNVTLTGNVSTSMHGIYGGGAAAISEGVATFLNCTVSGNSTNNIEPQLSAGGLVNTASVTLTNTLVAGNASPTFKPDLAGTFTSGGNNVVGNGDGISGLANGVLGDLVGSGASPVNALLAPLGAYGGPTQTMALLPGSPAIDGVTYNAPNGCPAADQRAVARPQGAACDVGAFESQGFSAAASAGTPQSAVIGTAFATPLAVTVTSASGEPVAGGVVPFSAPAAGASATLPGGGSTATATIDGSGHASVVATANGTVGSYLVTATPSGVTSSPTFSLTNLPLPTGLALVSAPNPSVYGDTVIFTATLAPAVTGATITFLEGATPLGTAATDASGVAAFSTTALQVGTHAINASWPGDSTHSGAASPPVSQVVSPRPVTVAADAKSKAYGEADPPLTYQLTIGSLVPGDTFTGALTRTPGETVGPYPILQGTLALPANYSLTYAGANLTIGPRAVTVTADAKSKVYGAPDPPLTYQVTSGSLVPGDTFTGALTRTPGETVGPYPILQGTLALPANYSLTYAGANLTIGPRAVTVTADPLTKVYGTTDPPLTYQVTSGSLAPGDSFTGSLARTPGEAVGPYAILQGTLALPAGYALGYVGASLTIGARAVSVTADPQSKVFGTADPALTYQVTSGSLATGDAFTGALARTPGEVAGTYPILQGTLALSGNYALGYVGANLTIEAASTTTTLTGTPSPAALGETVHLVATVAPVPPGTGTPSGVVTFLDGSTTLCAGVALDASGQAPCDVVAATPVGFHDLTAQFGGGASWLASSGALALDVFGAAPLFTSPRAATFSVGASGSFAIRTTGTPAPVITITDGTLPAGLTFVDNGDGTATISGVAEWSGVGSHSLTLSASNGAGSAAQDFVLRVVDFAQIPTLDRTGLSALALLLALAGAFALRRSACA